MDAAWAEAQKGGCNEQLWFKLADAREEQHPEDAMQIYMDRIGPTLDRTNNEAYREAMGYLKKIQALMKRCNRSGDFAGYLDKIKSEYKRKRNFMEMVGRARWQAVRKGR